MARKARPPPPPPPDGDTTPTLSSFPSPSSSSSSSDFEFLVSLSPTSRKSSAQLCPADELFYKGQLLPLHLSTRLSMVRTLILSDTTAAGRDSNGSSTSCDSTDTTATTTTSSPRDSSGSSNDSTASFSGDLLLLAAAAECESSRPSSVTEDDVARRALPRHRHGKYLSSLATKFSSVFHRNRKVDQTSTMTHLNHPSPPPPPPAPKDEQVPNASMATASCYFTSSAGRRAAATSGSTTSSSAKEVIKKYVKKVRPLYEKLSSLQNNKTQQRVDPPIHHPKKTFSFSVRRGDKASSTKAQTLSAALRSPHPPAKAADLTAMVEEIAGQDSAREMFSHSFSGNLRYPRKKRCAMAASCPSSMRSSPSHSGLLSSVGGPSGGHSFQDQMVTLHHSNSSSTTSMEELQSAIQGAIAHCKSTMKRGSTSVSDQI